MTPPHAPDDDRPADPAASLHLAPLVTRHRQPGDDERPLEELLDRALARFRRLADDVASQTPGGPSGSELFQATWLRRILPALGPDGPPMENTGRVMAIVKRMLRLEAADARREAGCQKRGGDRRRQTLADPAAPPGLPASMVEDVAEALGRLPERQRTAFVLHRMEGWTRAETAEKLGLSESAVRTLCKDAEAALKVLLADYGPEA